MVVVLMQASVSQLRLFAMTDNHTAGSNTTVEVINRVINDTARSGQQRILYLKLDNYTRKNKNKYLAAYLK